jgi:hypothetical protein
MVAAVHAWVLVPGAIALAPASYEPRLDLANELQGWPEVVAAVRAEVADANLAGSDDEKATLAVVGPHWVVCAQLEAALRDQVPVGCNTPVPDDFDAWWPRSRWRAADLVVWVSDARFGPASLAHYASVHEREVRIERAGRPVRLFTITLLARRAQA